jgi:hypothetical protein
MEHLLRQSPLAGVPASSPCVDAEQLAAWSAGRLRREDAALVERHLADCADCQAMLVAFVESEPVPGRATAPFWQRWRTRWLVPVAAASAGVLLWAVATREHPDVPDAAVTMARGESDARPQLLAPDVSPVPVEPTREQQTPPRAAAPPASSPSREARSSGAPAAPPTSGASQPLRDSALERQFAAALESAPTSPEPAARLEEPAAAPAIAPAPPPPQAAAPARRMAAGASSGAADTIAQGQANATTDSISAAGVVLPVHVRADAVAVQFGASAVAVRWRIHPDGRAERSSDRGQTWTRIELAPAASVSAGSAPAADVCWLVGRDGRVWRSTDGATFEGRSFPETVALVAVQAQGAAGATVTTADGRVFTTADGGTTWQGRP